MVNDSLSNPWWVTLLIAVLFAGVSGGVIRNIASDDAWRAGRESMCRDLGGMLSGGRCVRAVQVTP